MKLLNYGLLMLSCGVTGVFSAGCTTIRELPRETVAQQTKDKGYEKCRQLLIAFLKNDAKGFVSLLPENLQKEFTEKRFKETRKNITDSAGEPISFQYVTKLELSVFTPHIWKIRFKRTDRSGTREFTSEILFRIITAKLDNKIVITSFQFL